VTASILLPPDVRGPRHDRVLQTTLSEMPTTMMMLAQMTRGPSRLDIRTFEGPACDHIRQRVELVDPMKSGEIAGWLRGELRAPT